MMQRHKKPTCMSIRHLIQCQWVLCTMRLHVNRRLFAGMTGWWKLSMAVATMCQLQSSCRLQLAKRLRQGSLPSWTWSWIPMLAWRVAMYIPSMLPSPICKSLHASLDLDCTLQPFSFTHVFISLSPETGKSFFQSMLWIPSWWDLKRICTRAELNVKLLLHLSDPFSQACLPVNMLDKQKSAELHAARLFVGPMRWRQAFDSSNMTQSQWQAMPSIRSPCLQEGQILLSEAEVLIWLNVTEIRRKSYSRCHSLGFFDLPGSVNLYR